MKRFILFSVAIILHCYTVFSQDNNPKDLLKSGGDRFAVDLYTDIWVMDSDTNITIKSINPGVNFNYFFNIPVSGKFSLGLGLGIGTHNLWSNATPIDTFKNNTFTQFRKIPEMVNGKKIEYDINKLNMAYFDIPVEFRYTTTNKKEKKIKIALGLKGGYMISNHTKYKGTNTVDGDGNIKYKQYNVNNLELLRYGATFRLGYDKFHLYGYYSLSKLFKDEKGPEMYPVSLGVGLSI